MKKQEALKRIETQKKTIIELTGWAVYVYIMELIKSIDEPQKVKVPQFVADWYEEHKECLEYDVWEYLANLDKKQESEFYLWINDVNNKPLQNLVNMHQFGYEVEKEKRYLVKVKGMKRINGCLSNNKELAIWFFGTSGNSKNYSTHHTRKELEQAGFGWVFDCEGIEIEEVE